MYLCKYSFIGTQKHPFVYMLPMTAFMIQEQNWVVVTREACRAKTVSSGPLQKRSANLYLDIAGAFAVRWAGLSDCDLILGCPSAGRRSCTQAQVPWNRGPLYPSDGDCNVPEIGSWQSQTVSIKRSPEIQTACCSVACTFLHGQDCFFTLAP